MINVNLLYPVGSIYISVNSKNPSEIFGGTWERIKGKMLIAVDEDDQDFSTSGKTGGEKEVTLTNDMIPEHYHTFGIAPQNNSGPYIVPYGGNRYSDNAQAITSTVGGGQPHNNMPPYFAVYIWYRTA